MALEHGLRGGESAISPEDWEAWIDATERIGRSLNGSADLVVLHDPGTLGLAAGLDVPVTWRCHLDASRAEGDALALVTNLLDHCRLTLVPHQSFAPEAIRDAIYICVAFNVIDRIADAFDFEVPAPDHVRNAARFLLKMGYGG